MPRHDLPGLQNRNQLHRGGATAMFTSPGGNTQLICTWFHLDLWIHQHLELGNPTGAATAVHLAHLVPFKLPTW